MKQKFFILFLLLTIFQSLAFAIENIKIKIVHPPNAPYLIGIPEMNIDGNEFNTLYIKAKVKQNTRTNLFWATNFDPQMNQQKNIMFNFSKSTAYQDYYFNLAAQNPAWSGFILQILIFPESKLENIEIVEAYAIHSNFFTDVKSSWQEFWGPRGRAIIGSTINTIQSSTIMGQPIFVYIYWIIGLIFITLLMWQGNEYLCAKKKPSATEFMAGIGKSLVIATLIFWCLLEASSLINNFNLIRDEWKFFGKSQEEKLVMVNTGDFYPFIQFCEKNLKPDAFFDMCIPPIYNDIKAKYYLYPRKLTTTEADYMVVYDLKPEPIIFKNYLPWKQFRENAYILKKKGN